MERIKGRLTSAEVRQQAVEHYAEEDITRPPYNFRAREARFERANEQQTFDIEHRVFNAFQLSLVPPPPPFLDEEHPLIRVYDLFQKTLNNFDAGVSGTIEISRTRGKGPALAKSVSEDYEPKRKYLQRLLAYLFIYRRTTGTLRSNEIADFTDQVELIYLAHQVYAGVRSFNHDYEPLREDGDTVMKHVYDVSIVMINFFQAKIDREKNPKKVRKLYDRMKVACVVGLMHDLLEDHRRLKDDEVMDVMVSLTRFDTRILNLMTDSRLETKKTRGNFHFLRRKERKIKRMLKALTKPLDKEKRERYLTRKILKGSLKNDEEKADVIMIKNADRESNIASLKYMKDKLDKEGKVKETALARQNRKIHGSAEILDIGERVYQAIRDLDILDALECMAEACISESERLISENEPEIEAQELSGDIQIARSSIQRRLGNIHQAAAA